MENLQRIERHYFGKRLKCVVCNIRFAYHYHICEEWDSFDPDEKCFYTDESSDDDDGGNDNEYPIAQWVSVHAYIYGLCSPL